MRMLRFRVVLFFLLTALHIAAAVAQQQQQQQPQGGPGSSGSLIGTPASTIPRISNAEDARPVFPDARSAGVSRGTLRDAVPNDGLPPLAPHFTAAERNEFQDFVAISVGRMLPMFGYEFFDGALSTFAPVDGVPVTADYVIGPGDQIVIRAWGQVDIDYRATVDRNGAIHIPQVGSLTVGGLRYQDLHGFMRSAIGRVFRNFDLNVSLGQLRSIQVFVVGHARRPGAYTVSSLSTLVNALFVSGGPSTRGSMRSIQLKRGQEVVSTFDVYDLLLKGDKSKDARLLPGDVIYIPPIGDLVAVSGSVNQSAIYEIKPGTSVGDLLQLAGGLSAVAEAQKAKIERVADRRTRTVDEFDLDRSGLAKRVQNGDLLQIYALSPRFENAVSLRGSVANPGRFPWREGMRVRDIIPDRESLIVPDYWQRVNRVTRPFLLEPPADRAGETRPGEQRPADRRLDDPRLADRRLDDQRLGDQRLGDPRVGDQRLGDPRLGDRRLDDQRFGDRRLTEQRIGDPRTDDRRSADRRSPTAADTPADPVDRVRPRVEVKRLFDEINWDYALIQRLNPVDLTTVIIPFNLGRAVIDGDPSQNLALRPGDILTIFSRADVDVPVAKRTQFVRLEGEFRTPGVYQLLPDETLRQLVTRVGGFTPDAYVYGSELTRESVRQQQQRRLDESIERMAQEVERTAAGRAQAAAPEEKDSVQGQVEIQRKLIERLRTLRATGRIVLDVNPERSQVRDLPEISLEDGDRFFVPSRPSTVAVIGSVYNQTAFVHHPDKRLSEYLEMAGGMTRGADRAHTYVVRADGTVTGRAHSSVFSPFPSEKLQPGDTVVVPENLERFFLTKQLRDWTQIFSQFALGVAAIKVLKDF